MRTLITKYNVHLLIFEVIVQLVATISTIITRAFEVNIINVDIVDPETNPVNSPLVQSMLQVPRFIH